MSRPTVTSFKHPLTFIRATGQRLGRTRPVGENRSPKAPGQGVFGYGGRRNRLSDRRAITTTHA